MTQNQRPIGKTLSWGLLLALLLLLTNTFAQKSSVFDQLDLLVDVRHELTRNYVDKPDTEAMTNAAVEAMVESLDDPYTNYLKPDQLDRFNKSMQGEFSGIGAQVDMSQDRLRIVTPLEDSPAWEAGVMAGDIVLQINGESTLDLSLQEAVDKLTGEPGTDVTIRVRHESGEEETITITRAVIDVQTVRGFRRGADGAEQYMLDPDSDIAYIRVTQFSRKTAGEMRQALNTLQGEGINGLILDLRFNPGGVLEGAVAVSNMFLEKGKRIVSVEGRTVPEKVHRAKARTIMPQLPIVVLANEASASAAEIVTGALKDNDRAFVVGTRTFGKGSVQELRMLESNQGALKITNAHYYLPSGRNIHRDPDDDTWGVDPSEGAYVPMSQDQIREMIEIRRENEVLRRNEDKPTNNGSNSSENGEKAESAQTAPATQPAIDPAWLEQQRADPQLAAALKAIRAKLKADRWPKVGQDGADQLAQKRERQQLRKQREQLQQQLESVEKRLDALAPGRPATQPSE